MAKNVTILSMQIPSFFKHIFYCNIEDYATKFKVIIITFDNINKD